MAVRCGAWLVGVALSFNLLAGVLVKGVYAIVVNCGAYGWHLWGWLADSLVRGVVGLKWAYFAFRGYCRLTPCGIYGILWGFILYLKNNVADIQ